MYISFFSPSWFTGVSSLLVLRTSLWVYTLLIQIMVQTSSWKDVLHAGTPPPMPRANFWNGHSYHGSGAISSTRNQCDGTAPLQEAQWTVLLEFVDIILGRMPSSSGVHPAVVDIQVSMVLENRLHSFRSMMVYQGCVLGYRVLGNS